MKKLIYLILIIGVIVTFFGYRSYSQGLHYAKNPESQRRVTISIAEGSSAQQIARQLKEKGLIRSEWVFAFYLKQNDLAGQLKAGQMVVEENKTLPEIVEILVEGKSSEMAVTLLEGWTAQQIANHLEAEGVTSAEAFMDCVETCEFDFDFLPGYVEGYLYPDTYFVNSDLYSDSSFIERLIGTFESKLTEEDWAGIEASDYTLEEIMIMASIVEREERADSEKATVAGILWNRFNEGMSLGADATVLYALGRTNGGLTYQDLQTDSPYNTRKYAGLPPTPISNPSLSSIRAAIFPKQTDYWYYLHANDGQIYYGKTLEEHNQNKAKYLR